MKALKKKMWTILIIGWTIQVGGVAVYLNDLQLPLVLFLLLTNGLIGLGLHYSNLDALSFKSNPLLMADTFQIANETLPYLRKGLNKETATPIAKIIKETSQVAAVAITDRERVLAYLGAGCDKHLPGDAILTKATKAVIETGQPRIINSTQELDCPKTDCSCPLSKGIIVPLRCGDDVVGTLKFYQTESGELPAHVISLAKGIAQLLSTQIELAELNRQSQLVTEAKLEALHAQINPHFLFNTLNTIISFSRTDPHKTRQMLIHLADFFRHSLKKHEALITLKEELEYVNTYLFLEKARFGDKLKVVMEIDKDLLSSRLPVLSLQPLVENAIRHGVSSKIEGGTVKIIAQVEGEDFLAKVIDDGVGISTFQLTQILTPGYGSGNGVGLSNVDERLKGIYGKDYGIRISSVVDRGTTVQIKIPLTKTLGGQQRKVAGSDEI